MVAGGLHGTALVLRAGASAFEALRSDTRDAFTGTTRRRDGQLAVVGQSGQVFRYDARDRRLSTWSTAPPLPPLSDAAETASGRLIAVGVRGVHAIDLPPTPAARP